jgi:hypothetical protein
MKHHTAWGLGGEGIVQVQGQRPEMRYVLAAIADKEKRLAVCKREPSDGPATTQLLSPSFTTVKH